MKHALLLSALALCGCATLVNGTHVVVAIRSEPEGASFELRDADGQVVAAGETPASVRVARGRGAWRPGRYDLVVNKPGYLPKRTRLNTRLDELGFLDSLVVVPSLLDYTIGSAWKFEDLPVQVLGPDVPFPKP